MSVKLNELEPGEPNNGYWVVASNAHGTTESAHQTFATPAAATSPSIESESVSHVTSTGATLEAQINPQGSETEYKIWFWPSCTERVECERLPPPCGRCYRAHSCR